MVADVGATRLGGRLLNAVLLGAVVIGSIWLGRLVYHNRFGGHVEGPDPSWQGSISTEGSVTTVLNEAGSVWGGAARLVEEASIGVGAGAKEYMLGSHVGIAADDDRIYIADPSAPAVRVYDHDGRHLMDMGGPGQGPGEFNELRSVAVAPDGRVYVHADRRINVYSASGESVDTWSHAQGLDSVVAPVVAADGTLYMHDLVGDRSDVLAWQHGMIAAGPDGPHGEPIEVPAFEWEREGLIRRVPGGGWLNARVPFTPRLLWVMAPSRSIIAGVPSTHRFEIHAVDGSMTIVDNVWEPVPVGPEEAAWNRQSITSARRRNDPGWQWDGPPIPEHKPAYDGLHAGTEGRIWASRIVGTERLDDCDEDPTNPAGRVAQPCWRQLYGYDVFDSRGRLLGAAETPDQRPIENPVMRGDQLIVFHCKRVGLFAKRVE